MPHYFSEKQDSPERREEIIVKLRGNVLKLTTASGIFSKGHVDFGTRLLIEKCKPKGKILDLGCGYGAVGIALAKEGHEVTMADINERAIRIAKQNAKANKIEANIIKSDSFKELKEDKYDTILINPPQSAGKELCFSMIQDSINHLNKNGSLQLVARHNKGGKTLSSKMKEVFGNVDELAKQGGYRIYCSILN